MNPVKIDTDGIPCFCSREIDDYGLPSLYGYEEYRVIESRESEFVTDYKMETSYDLRPIHRYNRIDRLKTTMAELTGEKGGVPQEIITVIGHFLGNDKKDLWNRTRQILKHYKKRCYYNRIPYILKKLGLGVGICLDHHTNVYASIIKDFQFLHTRFNQLKDELNRKYFPSMRYTVLRLLELHGYKSDYNIPLVRTQRKNKSLEKIWAELIVCT